MYTMDSMYKMENMYTTLSMYTKDSMYTIDTMYTIVCTHEQYVHIRHFVHNGAKSYWPVPLQPA